LFREGNEMQINDEKVQKSGRILYRAMRILTIVVLICCVSLSHANQVFDQTPNPSGSPKAYLKLENGFPFSIDLYVDNERIGMVTPESEKIFELAPGNHNFRCEGNYGIRKYFKSTSAAFSSFDRGTWKVPGKKFTDPLIEEIPLTDSESDSSRMLCGMIEVMFSGFRQMQFTIKSGLEIVIVDEGTKTVYTTYSNTDGFYHLDNIPIESKYRIVKIGIIGASIKMPVSVTYKTFQNDQQQRTIDIGTAQMLNKVIVPDQRIISMGKTVMNVQKDGKLFIKTSDLGIPLFAINEKGVQMTTEEGTSEVFDYFMEKYQDSNWIESVKSHYRSRKEGVAKNIVKFKKGNMNP
jgi:hypothetical protein